MEPFAGTAVQDVGVAPRVGAAARLVPAVAPAAASTSAHARPAPPVHGFNLLRWFSIASLLALIPVAAAIGTLVSSFITRQALQRDASLTAQFISNCLAVEAAQIGAVSLVPFLDPRAQAQGPDVARALRHTYEHLETLPDALLVNVYATDGRIVWSTNPQLIGEVVTDNDELRQAMRSHADVALHHPSNVGARAEQRFVVEPEEFFIENYVPLLGPDGKVRAVVEVYKEPGHLMDSIRAGHDLVWSTTLAGGVVIYLGLFSIVRRASRVLAQQQQLLVEAQSQVFAGDMARALAHSLRNPLGSVRSSAELAGCSDDEAVRKHANDIVAQVDFLSQWVRELLLYSRPAVGEVEAVEVCGVLASVLGSFQPTFERAGIALRREPAECTPVHVQGNTALARQALHSVVSHAVENMPHGGELCIALHPAAGAGQVLELVVSGSKAARGPALGARLPLLNRAMQRFGGSVSLASTPQAGTEVRLRFQRFAGAAEPATPAAAVRSERPTA